MNIKVFLKGNSEGIIFTKKKFRLSLVRVIFHATEKIVN